ncbi:MAG: class I SAM-dependent methyltransferase [Gaiellaceae bacterium]
MIATASKPVTERLLELLDAQPGERILELGAGLGEVSELLIQVVGDDGEIVLTDNSPGMLRAAEARLGRPTNVTFALANAESTEFEDGSFDRVVARFALMLAPDVAAAFAEARRVLRLGGRLAFAVWTPAPDNPWGSTIGRTMLRLGLSEPPEPDAPGPFRLGDPHRLRSLLASAGFEPPRLETVDIEMRYESPAHYWEVTRDLSSMLRTILQRLSEPERVRFERAVAEALEPYASHGGVSLPGRAWVAAADHV